MAHVLAEVRSGICVAQSANYATNTTVLATPDVSLVIDPAWLEPELARLAADVATLSRLVLGFATHVHYDHVIWHPDLGPGPRLSARWTAWAASEHRLELVAELSDDLPEELLGILGRLEGIEGTRAVQDVPSAALRYAKQRLPDPVSLEFGGREVLLHEHDAHAPAHLALEYNGVLVAGDMLSDIELPMPDDANPDLGAYLAGLDRLAEVVRRVNFLIPGHGAPTDQPIARLDQDRHYLDDLLQRGDSDDPRRYLPEMAELHRANQQRARYSKESS